jgi:hypothetical protein
MKLNQTLLHGEIYVPTVSVPFYGRIGDDQLCPISAYRPGIFPNTG